MAAWADVCHMMTTLGAVQKGQTAWFWQAPVRGGTHQRMVFVSYEVMQPDLELVDIKSAFARTSEVDPQAILDNFGHLQVGAIACTPVTDAGGGRIDSLLSIATTIPLAVLDHAATGMFALYLALIGDAADRISQMISSSILSQPAPAR